MISSMVNPSPCTYIPFHPFWTPGDWLQLPPLFPVCVNMLLFFFPSYKNTLDSTYSSHCPHFSASLYKRIPRKSWLYSLCPIPFVVSVFLKLALVEFQHKGNPNEAAHYSHSRSSASSWCLCRIWHWLFLFPPWRPVSSYFWFTALSVFSLYFLVAPSQCSFPQGPLISPPSQWCDGLSPWVSPLLRPPSTFSLLGTLSCLII